MGKIKKEGIWVLHALTEEQKLEAGRVRVTEGERRLVTISVQFNHRERKTNSLFKRKKKKTMVRARAKGESDPESWITSEKSFTVCLAGCKRDRSL